MELTFAPRDVLQISEARLIHRNFAGEGSKYNREGERNFSVVIPTEEMADALIEKGWNVKKKGDSQDDRDPLMYLPVKVKFNGRGPNVYLTSGSNMHKLDEESIHMLDEIDISYADMDIRPSDWSVNGKTGRAAYLHSINVVQDRDRFADQYDEINNR